MKKKIAKRRGIKLWERRIFVSWLRFSRKHRHSRRLPFFLFALVFVDGFTMIIPAMLCLMACVTISPARWWIFATIFPLAATLNNFVTYCLGTLVPHSVILSTLEFFHLQSFWEKAGEAIHQYGDWAAFVGALMGLPTQMITAMIGLADMQVIADQEARELSIVSALVLVLIGHSLKAYALAGLTRYGWIKLENKIAESEK